MTPLDQTLRHLLAIWPILLLVGGALAAAMELRVRAFAYSRKEQDEWEKHWRERFADHQAEARGRDERIARAMEASVANANRLIRLEETDRLRWQPVAEALREVTGTQQAMQREIGSLAAAVERLAMKVERPDRRSSL